MKSIEVFEENIKATDLFTARIHAISTFVKQKPEELPKTLPPEIIKFVSFDESHFDKIFETGFIGQFANFEYFMYEFLKELYKKHPKAIPSDKTVKAEDVLQFNSYKSIRDFLIDAIAIENSYDLEVWNNTVQKLFNIKPISDEVKVRLMIMNSMRNLFLHSGGHWNSKALKDSRKIEKTLNSGKTNSKTKDRVSKKKTFNTSKSALTAQTAYITTMKCFHDIIKDIKSQIEKKNNRVNKQAQHKHTT